MNLQRLCILSITRHFERFYFIYTTSNDEKLEKSFEYLQRMHSYQILIELLDCGKLRREYLDFLINKYTTEVDSAWLRTCPWKTIVAKFAEVGSRLRKVCFSQHSKDFLPWQDVIHHLTNLEVFSYPRHCTDEVLKCVSQSCPNIVEINVHYSFVTNKGIKYLCMKENGKPLCPKLKKVFIHSCEVTDKGVINLIQNVKSLEMIDIAALPIVLYSIHENDLPDLNKIEPYNLTTLDLMGMLFVLDYTNLLEICVSVCPFLKHISCPILNEKHLDLISNFLHLEMLDLKCFSRSEIDVTDLIKRIGRKLISLTVSFCFLSVVILSESCPRLERLFLYDVAFKIYEDGIPSFNCLETCIFTFRRYDATTAKSVSSLLKYSPKLTFIGFKECNLASIEIKTEILKCCESCPITEIDISGSTISTDYLKDVLMSCRSLKFVSLNITNTIDTYCQGRALNDFAKTLPNKPQLYINSYGSFCFRSIKDCVATAFFSHTFDWEQWNAR